MAGVVETHQVPDIEAMRAVAATLSKKLKAGDILLLTGELGSGKTTFTQALAAALRVAEPITSPTFTIVAEYGLPASSSLKQFVHIDLYRLGSVVGEDLQHLKEVFETAHVQDRLVVVEWADRLSEAPEHAWQLAFAHGIKPTERIVSIEAP